MKPRYFADEHINKDAIEQLRLKGLDIVHCSDVGMTSTADILLLEYAVQANRVMLTADRKDFRRLYFVWMEQERHHSGIILLHPDRHAKHIGEIVRIVMYFHELADTAEDMRDTLWTGEDAD